MDNSGSTDTLALYRTMLANRRTYLSFIRSSLSMLAAGIAAIKVFDHVLFGILGWGLIAASMALGFHGYISHRQTTKVIREAQTRLGIAGADLD